MKEIGIQRAIEEVTIDGVKYQIDLSDAKKKKYSELSFRMKKVGSEMGKVAKIEDEKVLRNALDELKHETQAIMDELLGEGSFDEIYPKTNESTENTLMVIGEVMTYIRERQEEMYQEKFQKKREKYVKSK
ncbi:phage protein [Oceanobacillus picturae]|uniref:Phage protein n=1 Tax=Oceanobacillus picturae TaxID=171693 RepID=A0A0U9HD79_9BACI|nr:hypothetical protein [Oceanobacillus picturae]GAQ18036.1 phage protein [Oceanobacillus picturae]